MLRNSRPGPLRKDAALFIRQSEVPLGAAVQSSHTRLWKSLKVRLSSQKSDGFYEHVTSADIFEPLHHGDFLRVSRADRKRLPLAEENWPEIKKLILKLTFARLGLYTHLSHLGRSNVKHFSPHLQSGCFRVHSESIRGR